MNPDQQKAGAGNTQDVVPFISKTRGVQNTPFNTNVAKEVYINKKQDDQPQQQPSQPQQQPSQPQQPISQRNAKTGTTGTTGTSGKGIPITQSKSTTSYQGAPAQPTFKLEMFAPPPEQQKPFGLYNPYVPQIEIPFVPKKFSPAAFQYLSAPTSAFSYGPNLKMPMQQVYNINLPGPTGGHVEMNKIYENILPGKENQFTSTTLGERLQLYNYIYPILIKKDGEEISIDSNGHNSLMSYIKIMELNPNYYSPLYNNPYKGLPFGLLIYRSCFPIKMDKISQSTICAKNSIGLNIRLYSLSCAEYYLYTLRQPTYKEYDVWRELAYYEYIRDNILKKKKSPNFPLVYGFLLSPNKKIDFFSLKKRTLTQKEQLSAEYKRFIEIHTLFSSVKPSTDIIRPMTLPDMAKKVIAKLPDEIDPIMQVYSGTTLIIITEAPNHNLYQWASRIYEKEGIVNKMISHGYHEEPVWFGVLFQIIAALYVMQIDGIYMRNMTIEDNVYIKDLQIYGKASGYWKYVIDGISYYIPNYGYVVMLDSNFKDIIPSGQTNEQCKREYKIYTSNIIGKKYPIADIRKKVFENYRNIINTNSFTNEHTQNNVSKPPQFIMNLISSMMIDPEMDLGKIISTYFRAFMHNRIGTLLRKDTEVPNIREITSPFRNGEMAIEVIEEDKYKWCLVLNTKPNSIIEIITRKDDKSTDFMVTDVRVETLKQYSASEKIEQNNSSDLNLSEDELLETYLVTRE